MSINANKYKNAMARFTTGVCVVASGWGEELHAMTANAVSSVSLDPAQLLVCVQRDSNCAAALARHISFSVNVLREDQGALSAYFAGLWEAPRPPKFAFVPWKGVPRLRGAISAFGCRLINRVESGDHDIVIGEVEAVYCGPGSKPLVYFDREYRRLG